MNLLNINITIITYCINVSNYFGNFPMHVLFSQKSKNNIPSFIRINYLKVIKDRRRKKINEFRLH